MDLDQRIAQFENMASADPNNEMAHFSLGGAYAQAGRHADAARAYLRCTEVNPEMSKAYQLAGEQFIKARDHDRAADLLTRGYAVAAQNGDLMPKRAMADLLEQLGRPIPTVENAAPEIPLAEGAMICFKTGRPGTRLERPPFRGPLGQWIADNITAETWNDWIGQGTKVINELRLDLSRDEDSETYDRYMREYLGVDEQLYASLCARS